jgi:hypothetical protein
MDALPSPSDDMKELERRLSEWRPSTAGLDAEGVLFDAGRASVRPGWGRIAWPIVSGCLALLAAILSVQLSQERSARLELASRLRNSTPAVVPAPSSLPETYETPLDEPPAADSYLAARRALAGNPDSWLATAKTGAEGAPSPSRAIWKAGSNTDLLEP